MGTMRTGCTSEWVCRWGQLGQAVQASRSWDEDNKQDRRIGEGGDDEASECN